MLGVSPPSSSESPSYAQALQYVVVHSLTTHLTLQVSHPLPLQHSFPGGPSSQ